MKVGSNMSLRRVGRDPPGMAHQNSRTDYFTMMVPIMY
jgi:hypothetical protein